MTTIKRSARAASAPQSANEGIDLEMKLEPAQSRARETIEQIIVATAELLEEVGFERLSTNMVCKRANITPPALYRYFPNKYAILREMGRRLMEAEDAIVFRWLESGEGDGLARRSLSAAVRDDLCRWGRCAGREWSGRRFFRRPDKRALFHEVAGRGAAPRVRPSLPGSCPAGAFRCERVQADDLSGLFRRDAGGDHRPGSPPCL